MIDAAELAARFELTDEELEDHLQLLNLVNFGGGCYAVYAERVERRRTISRREGALRRRVPPPARLSPLEAKALLLALDLVGPLVAADSGTALDDVRAKLEAAFGALRHARGARRRSRRRSTRTCSRCSRRRVREPRSRARSSTSRAAATRVGGRVVEPHHLRGVRGDWYCDTWDRTRRRRAHVPRRPHPRGARARRDVRAPRERRPRASTARSATTRARRRCGSRPTSRAGSSRAGPTRSRLADGAALASVPYGSRALALRPSSAATSATPCCSSPSRCAPASRRARASSRALVRAHATTNAP